MGGSGKFLERGWVLVVAFGPATEVRAWWRIMRRISVGREVKAKGKGEGDGGGGDSVVLAFFDIRDVLAMLSTTR